MQNSGSTSQVPAEPLSSLGGMTLAGPDAPARSCRGRRQASKLQPAVERRAARISRDVVTSRSDRRVLWFSARCARIANRPFLCRCSRRVFGGSSRSLGVTDPERARARERPHARGIDLGMSLEHDSATPFGGRTGTPNRASSSRPHHPSPDLAVRHRNTRRRRTDRDAEAEAPRRRGARAVQGLVPSAKCDAVGGSRRTGGRVRGALLPAFTGAADRVCPSGSTGPKRGGAPSDGPPCTRALVPCG